MQRLHALARVLIVTGAVAIIFALTPQGGAQAVAAEPNSADALIFWTDCSHLLELTDAELDAWKSRGVDGFVCMHGHLQYMGGSQDFTGNAGASLAGSNYRFQRRLRDTGIVGRLRARAMKAYLGIKLVNYYNPATPLRDWFDDPGWSGLVLPKMADAAAAARLLGFAGLAFDGEPYRQQGGVTASWAWNYVGNSRSEREVRAKARQRGCEIMGTLTRSYPGIELMARPVHLPQTWLELVQEEINGKANALAGELHPDFWDGLSSSAGYDAIRLVDSTFYKTPHLGSWDTAFQYHFNTLYSFLSRRISNWNYASSRIFVSPAAWIGPGPRSSRFDDARPPAYVGDQLAAFRKWSMGGEFTNYTYGGLRGFDYKPYVSAMQAASSPGVVDRTPPALVVNSPRAASAASLTLRGRATDNLAIRFVRWRNKRGGSGAARLSWKALSGDYLSGYTWRTRWAAPKIPLRPGKNRITVMAQDIKGLTTKRTITINGRRSAKRSRGRRLTVRKVSYRPSYTLADACSGIRITLPRVGSGLRAMVSNGGQAHVRRRGRKYVLQLELPGGGSYQLRLTPLGGPGRTKTITIRVV